MSATQKTVTDNASAYDAALPIWQRNRAVRSGSVAVKAAGETYLPKTSTAQKDTRYEAYKKRAYFYPATGRTVDAYTGLIFRKPPQVQVPSALDPYLADIDLQGTSLDGFAEKSVEDVVVVARGGLLVEFPVNEVEGITAAEAERSNLRPYLAFYPAENIRDWRSGRIAGKTMTTFIKLFERVSVETDNIFQDAFIEQYRVLRINELGRYEIVIYREMKDAKGVVTWVEWQRREPMVNGKPVDYIPFVFLGPRRSSSDVQESPISDIVEVNLSHYVNSADYENGLHWSGTPTPIFSGQFQQNAGEAEVTKIEIGGESGIHFADTNGKAEYLEYQGGGLKDGLGAALDRKEKHMALLGSRVLMDERKLAEAAETAQIHRAGEASVLASLAAAVSTAFTRALKIMAEWVKADPEAVVFALNTDFLPESMDAAQLQALLLAWQGGAISYPTLFENLQKGEIVRSGKTPEDELAEIEAETPDIEPPPAAPPVPPVVEEGAE